MTCTNYVVWAVLAALGFVAGFCVVHFLHWWIIAGIGVGIATPIVLITLLYICAFDAWTSSGSH